MRTVESSRVFACPFKVTNGEKQPHKTGIAAVLVRGGSCGPMPDRFGRAGESDQRAAFGF